MDIKNEVSKIIAKRVDISNLKEEDNLSELGLDSLDLVEVMLEIEEVFGIEFSSDEIEGCKTLKDVLNLIVKKAK
ncbi:MAG: acyl carrier protein [Bacilli bacterium]|nr:acyl carrier protein [Bacilli bacterium]